MEAYLSRKVNGKWLAESNNLKTTAWGHEIRFPTQQFWSIFRCLYDRGKVMSESTWILKQGEPNNSGLVIPNMECSRSSPGLDVKANSWQIHWLFPMCQLHQEFIVHLVVSGREDGNRISPWLHENRQADTQCSRHSPKHPLWAGSDSTAKLSVIKADRKLVPKDECKPEHSADWQA